MITSVLAFKADSCLGARLRMNCGTRNWIANSSTSSFFAASSPTGVSTDLDHHHRPGLADLSGVVVGVVEASMVRHVPILLTAPRSARRRIRRRR